jgi:propionyl-CoA carboxylase beta chain
VIPTESRFDTLFAMRAKALAGGGARSQEAQHHRGKLTARERLHLLFDPHTFIEMDAFVTHNCHDFGMGQKHVLGDGVVTGWGSIDGRTVYAYAQDFTVFGGSLSRAVGDKVAKVMRLALQNKAPIISLNDSGGARIHEGVVSLGGYGDIFYLNVQASGVIPQISLIMGPCAGGAVYSPAMTDFTLMVDETSHMFITGPAVVKTVTGENVSFEELGGSVTHATKSGVIDKRFASEEEMIREVKALLKYLPSHFEAHAPYMAPSSLDPDTQTRWMQSGDFLNRVVPTNPLEPYDMKDVIRHVVDFDSFWEVKPEFAPNIVVGFARLNGHSIGVVGNNPISCAGSIDINAATKAARFVRTCDAFNIPIVTFVDVPGYFPGRDQEEGGIIRHGAKILYAYCEATVPKLTVITRKAYGGSYLVMGSKHCGGDLNLAWPTAEIAVMGSEAACNIIFRKEIESSPDPEAHRKHVINEYAKKFATPYEAAQKGYVDAVILPSETREYLIKALAANLAKTVDRPRRKHGNIPL